MSSSLQKSNLRLLFYSAPVAVSFILLLATGGVISLPFSIVSQIQALLGNNGMKVFEEALKLLSSAGVNLLTAEGHDRFKEFLQGLSKESLFSDKNIKETIKKAIIGILKDEKEKSEYNDQKKNIERLINSLNNLFSKAIKLKNEDLSQDFLALIPKLSEYEIDKFRQSTSPLTKSDWKKLLIDVAIQENVEFYIEGIGLSFNIPKDFDFPLEGLSKTLEERFPAAFRRLIERDIIDNGEVFAKYTLDFLTKIANSNIEILALLEEFSNRIELIEQNSSSLLEQGQTNQIEITDFLEKVSNQIRNIETAIASDVNNVFIAKISQINIEISEGFNIFGEQLTLITTSLTEIKITGKETKQNTELILDKIEDVKQIILEKRSKMETASPSPCVFAFLKLCEIIETQLRLEEHHFVTKNSHNINRVFPCGNGVYSMIFSKN